MVQRPLVQGQARAPVVARAAVGALALVLVQALGPGLALESQALALAAVPGQVRLTVTLPGEDDGAEGGARARVRVPGGLPLTQTLRPCGWMVGAVAM